MKLASLLTKTLAVTAIAVLPASLAAQATIGADAAVNSAYLWRGITFTNKPVLQPDLYVTVPAGKASITVGGWGNIEPGRYNGSTDLSEGGGAKSFDLTEFDWWGEAGFPVGPATATLGATGYIFPNDFGFTSAANTTEIYGKLGFAGPLTPKVAVWYDIDNVKGMYGEFSVGHGFALTPAVPLTLGALMGYNQGQEVNTSDASEGFNFAKSGITHFDLSAASSFAAGMISIAPQVHVILGQDDATKYSKLDPNSSTGVNNTSTKFWLGATLSWTHAMGAKPAEK